MRLAHCPFLFIVKGSMKSLPLRLPSWFCFLCLCTFFFLRCSPQRPEEDLLDADLQKNQINHSLSVSPMPEERGHERKQSGSPSSDGIRSCSLILQLHAPTAQSVKLAGPFSQWAKAPWPLIPQGQGTFAITLSPETHPQLLPGQQYPYKFIIDGVWKLDSSSSYRA
jgi:hypothetical protein